MSEMYLDGIQIDYIETLEGAGFKFNNPNVKHFAAAVRLASKSAFFFCGRSFHRALRELSREPFFFCVARSAAAWQRCSCKLAVLPPVCLEASKNENRFGPVRSRQSGTSPGNSAPHSGIEPPLPNSVARTWRFFRSCASADTLPLDLLERPEFPRSRTRCVSCLAREGIAPYPWSVIRHVSPDAPASPSPTPPPCSQPAKSSFEQHKMLLPTYDVFDESRYFEPARQRTVFAWPEKLGITVCEDIWNDKNFWARRRYDAIRSPNSSRREPRSCQYLRFSLHHR